MERTYADLNAGIFINTIENEINKQIPNHTTTATSKFVETE